MPEQTTKRETMIKIIATVDEPTSGIGYGNALPWPLVPEDIKHFRDTTINKTVVMGSLTFLSLGEVALPNRKNVVITRKKRNFYRKEIVQVQHPEQVLKWKGDVYIIGGASIYAAYISYASKMIITELDFPKDTRLMFDKYFPVIDMSKWNIKRGKWLTSVSDIKYRIVTYTRKY